MKLRKLAIYWSVISRKPSLLRSFNCSFIAFFAFILLIFLTVSSFSSHCFIEKKLVYVRRMVGQDALRLLRVCSGIEIWIDISGVEVQQFQLHALPE
jgi:hypothetical protein